jgi:hypothetical protein
MSATNAFWCRFRPASKRVLVPLPASFQTRVGAASGQLPNASQFSDFTRQNLVSTQTPSSELGSGIPSISKTGSKPERHSRPSSTKNSEIQPFLSFCFSVLAAAYTRSALTSNVSKSTPYIQTTSSFKPHHHQAPRTTQPTTYSPSYQDKTTQDKTASQPRARQFSDVTRQNLSFYPNSQLGAGKWHPVNLENGLRARTPQPAFFNQ